MNRLPPSWVERETLLVITDGDAGTGQRL